MIPQPTPLVSIVLATYNGSAFLREQLDSLFQQTYSPIEILAIDDCSSDSTIAILDEYASSNANLKIYQNKNNLGHIKTFEKGISLCSGEHVSLCDQDDVWDKSKVTLMMEAWDKDASLIYCDSLFIDHAGNSLNRKVSDIKNLATYTSAIPFIIGNTVPGHAAMFKKNFAQQTMPFPPTIIHDWWLAFIAAAHGKIQFLDKPLVNYRQHSGNVIGAIKIKGRGKSKPKSDKLELIRKRVLLFCEVCPESSDAKAVLKDIVKSYADFSVRNNFLRMHTFFKHKDLLLATKKKDRL